MTRRGFLIFLGVMFVMVILGCSTVNKVLQDYQTGITDVDGLGHVANVAVLAKDFTTGFVDTLPNMSGIGQLIGSLVGLGITFIGGVFLGKKKRK